MVGKYYILLFAVSVFFIIVFGLIRVYVNPEQDTLEFEFAEALLQVGVISAAGALASLLSFEYQRERQRIDMNNERLVHFREDLLRATLTKAGESYNTVKEARRLLRSRAIILGGELDRELVLGTTYDECMAMVNDAQLSFELLVDDVESNPRAFKQHEQLEADLRSVEEYLGHLIGEYEQKRRAFQENPPCKELTSLPELSDFLGPSKPSEFRKQVVRPYHGVQRNIQANLIDPQFPKSEENSE